jgi:hypothetical protein
MLLSTERTTNTKILGKGKKTDKVAVEYKGIDINKSKTK